MKVIHQISEGCRVESQLADFDNRGFCLGGPGGGYFWLDREPSSRYQGWFCDIDGILTKILENIEVVGAAPASAVINGIWNAKRVRGALTEKFFIPAGRNALVYETTQAADIRVTLDVKEIFENVELGRIYDVASAGANAMVIFKRDKDKDGRKLFIAVKSDSARFAIVRDWVKRNYSYDRQRGSRPYERWVFQPLTALGASEVVLAIGSNPDGAAKEADFVFSNLALLKSKRRREFIESSDLYKRHFGIDCRRGLHSSSELAAGGLCAANALQSLLFKKNGEGGLRAGFPWFPQFWQRDEALSLGGLFAFNAPAGFDVFWRLVGDLENGVEKMAPDGVGWVLFRARGLVLSGALSAREKEYLAGVLEKTVSYLLKKQTAGGLAANSSGMTWMDSIDRAGCRVEIQALRLNLYRLASILSPSPTKREFYGHLELDLLLKTKKLFADGDILADGYDPISQTTDLTARPNIFLAAYAYPELLSAARWQNCFDGALRRLWLDWGGLASVDTADARFHPLHSGENPASYHNGDSWFYLNNIAALVLHRASPVKYHPYVKKIFDTGIRNVLWGQVAGFGSELSSARRFEPAGCFNQAWTNATFLELFREIGAGQKSFWLSARS